MPEVRKKFGQSQRNEEEYFKKVFFSSKCSSEHVKCRFDNFAETFMTNVRKLPKIRLRSKKKKVSRNISFHQSVRLKTWKTVLTICRIDFVKTQKKVLLKLRKKTHFQNLLFSSKCSSENVECSFNHFSRNSMRNLRTFDQNPKM